MSSMKKFHVRVFLVPEDMLPEPRKIRPPKETMSFTIRASSSDKARALVRSRLNNEKLEVVGVNFAPDPAGRLGFIAYVKKRGK